MGTINISLSDEMIARIDSVIRNGNYKSRSELLREAIRDFFAKSDELSRVSGTTLAVITVSYDLTRKGTSEAVNLLQHKNEGIILTTMHNHSGENCLEMILAKADIQDITHFAKELKKIRGVNTVKITVA